MSLETITRFDNGAIQVDVTPIVHSQYWRLALDEIIDQRYQDRGVVEIRAHRILSNSGQILFTF